MKVFVTGATGFVGTQVVNELLGAGHSVTGLARSDASAEKLAAAGAAVRRGDLTDPDSLVAGASEADAVIHLGFIHDFSNFLQSVEVDRQAIEAMGTALAGSDRPLIVTSGLALKRSGPVATEEDRPEDGFPRASERAAMAFVDRGVRASAVRLAPSVHGDGDHGFVPRMIAIAREKGVSAYVGEGANIWPGVHVGDAGKLFALAVEKGEAGKCYHGVGDGGFPVREIAAVIGRKLGVPVASISPDEAAAHFGWFEHFARFDVPASSELTRQRLGWRPVGPTLLEDLENGTYFDA